MRVAVFGCGSIGRRHAANLSSVPDVELMIHDVDRQQAETAGRQMSVPVARDLDEVWQWRPDAAVVATPPSDHVALAMEAVRRDCDVLVEKPLAHALTGVRELLDEAERRRLVTLVGCNMRFHPGPATVKRLLDAGAIGDVLAARLKTGSYLPDWRPGQDYRASYSASRARGGGAVLDCIHEIDLALWMLGPARLAASVVRPAAVLGLEVDGLAEILLEHASGTVSSVHLNFVQRDYRRGCEVVGATGTIAWDFETPEVVVRRGTGSERHALPDGWTVDRMYRDEMAHFVDCVRSRATTIAPLAQGAAALEIALAARDGAGARA